VIDEVSFWISKQQVYNVFEGKQDDPSAGMVGLTALMETVFEADGVDENYV
jgi:hypothetical protein